MKSILENIFRQVDIYICDLKETLEMSQNSQDISNSEVVAQESPSGEHSKRKMEENAPETTKKQRKDVLQSLEDSESTASSVRGTPEVEQIIKKAEFEKHRDLIKGKCKAKHEIRNKARDVVAAQRFLDERYDELKEIRLSQKLLKKKVDEDNGVEMESDSDGEDFEDLLELFGIDPEEISLDIGVNERQKLLMDAMDDDQQTRYETFRRSNLNINGIRKLVNGATGINVPNDFAKIIAGVGKVFVGQIVERAKEVQRREGETKVTLQLNYLDELQQYETSLSLGDLTMDKPLMPTFYDSLLQSETGTGARRDYTSDTFKIIIPQYTTQLTPDQVREAWHQYSEEGQGAINGRWRQEGGGRGNLFR